MKKVVYCLLVLCCCLGFVGCDQIVVDDRPTLIVGLECDYAPFNWTDNQANETNYPIDGTGLYADGYDVQIAKLLADSLDRRLVIKAITWDGLIAALESNTIDVIIAGMSPTADRKESIDFTDAYYRSTHVLVMEATSQYVNGKTLNDFSGARVVGQTSTLYDSLIDQLVGVEHQTSLADIPNIVSAILYRRSDITILEEPVAIGVCESNPSLTYITLTSGFDVNEEDVVVSIGTRKTDTELTAALNEALATITETQRSTLMTEAIERAGE